MGLDPLIEKIIEYSGSASVPYIDRFNKNWISFMIEDSDTLKVIQDEFKEENEKGFDVYTFIRIFLNILPHEEDETLYLAIVLIDLFKNICDSYSRDGYIKSSDILNYIVENFLNKNNKDHVIQTRKLPLQKKFHVESQRVRQIDLDAPIIHGSLESQIRRLNKSKIISDSTHHNNNGIRKVCFGEQAKRIFALDSLADNICVFNLNCTLEKRLIPHQAKLQKDTVILDFTWSNSQQRIGATLKEWTLAFWEANDNYELEKSFSTLTCLPDHQLRIWYIEFLNLWVTTDKTCALHVWDIEKECVKFSLSSAMIQSNIIDVLPLEVLRLVAVCSLDKIVTIWNFQKKRVLMKIDLTDGGVHSMAWSNTYQVLLTAGYENKIKVWSLDQTSQDTELVGKLVGHATTVFSVEFIRESPMIASADDSGHIKVWDIRNLNCVQTLSLDVTTISKLIDISKFGKLAFIGNRINLLDFEEGPSHANPLNSNQEQVWPVKADYDKTEDQIILCTRKDIRFIDASLGRVKKIFVGLLKSEEADISMFKLMHQNKNFVLGDDHGEINIYNTNTGEMIKSLAPHQNEVTHMKFDYVNNLIISSGGDSRIHIQKETKASYEMKRTIKNLHFNKEVSLMEVSVYHNLILTAGNNNVIFVWDYEYVKPLANIHTLENSEPTLIYFINGYAITIIADTTGKIYFLHFKKRDNTFISFQKIGEIDVSSTEDQREEENPVYATKIMVDIEETPSKNEVHKCNMYISTNKGDVRLYDIVDVLKHENVKHIPHANTRTSYNCNRNIEEDFLKVIATYKLPVCDLSPPDKINPFITSTLDLTRVIDLNHRLLRNFKAHNDCLTTLTISNCPEKRLFTTSLDSYIKVWTLEGTLLGSLNINYPLPTTWNLDVKDVTQHKKKIFYALKVLDQILRRYKKDMFLEEEKKISVNQFLKHLNSNKGHLSLSMQDSRALLNEAKGLDQESNKKNIVLMRDEYSPRDIHFEKAKNIYRKELQGPSLRQMEITKKISTSNQSKSLKSKELALQKIEEEERNEKQAEDEKLRQEFISFLVGDVRSKILEQREENDGLKTLSKKLEMSIQNENKSIKLDSVQLSSKPSFPALQRMKSVKFHQATLANIQEIPSDHTPSSVKTQSTLEHLGSMRLKLQRNTPSMVSPIKGYSTLISPAQRASELKNIDFFMYAKRKIEVQDFNSLPALSGMASNDRQEIHSEAYSRKLKKRNFNEILTKLDETKRKSQITSTRFFGGRHSSSIRGTPVNNPRAYQIPSLQLDSSKKSLPPNRELSIEKQLQTEEKKPFLEELQDISEKIKESWNLKDSENTNTKLLFSNVMKKVSRKQEDLREFVSDYSVKMKEILKEVKLEQQQ